jgi:hypothetical protein
VIGGIKRWGMAYDQFSNGNILEGLKQLGLGLLTFVGGGPIIYGIEMLMGMFGNEEKSQTDLNIDTSWTTKLKDWIKKKLKDLPYVLRKPLEWFGILDSDEKDAPIANMASTQLANGYEWLKNESAKAWDSATNTVANGYNWLKEKSIAGWKWLEDNNVIDNVKNTVANGYNWLKEKSIAGWKWLEDNGIVDGVKDTISNGYNWMKEKLEGIWKEISPILNDIKDIFITLFSKIVGYIKNIISFGGNNESKNVNQQWKENSQNIPTVTASASPNAPSILAEVANAQLKTLRDIHQVTYSIYQSVKGGIGGGGSNTMIPIPMNSSSQSNSQPRMMPMNSNRGDYGSSPYALA